MTIKAKKSKINLREKLAELLNFRQIRDRLDGLGLYLGKDRTGTTENLAVRGGASIDDLQLAEISAALGGTAVDVFVYDTQNDSDGGKWRERTQNTSWYNEELNTATRGGRREFPAVAVIVAESDKVTIYDGDDPDLSMWMVFNNTSGNATFINGWTNSSVAMLNGVMYVGQNLAATWVNFITDTSGQDRETAGRRIYLGNIADLETTDYGFTAYDAAYAIVDAVVNDVAMTVLPNAPIDTETGLPVPTIAVATDGGVSVIKDDGSVVDKGTTSAAVNQVQWMGSSRLVATAPGYYGVFDDPFVEESAAFLGYISDNVYYHDHTKNHLYQVPNIIAQLDANSKLLTLDTRTIIASTSAGLDVHEMGEGAAANNNHGIATYITSEYNTGWMPGDIKLATLSDTKIEKVGVDESTELITNITDRDFSGPLVEWSGDITPIGGEGVISDPSSVSAVLNLSGLTAGKKYTMSFEIISIESGTPRMFMDNTVEGKGALNYTTGSHYKTFTALGETATATFYVLNVGGGTYNVDNFSLKQTGELITNGTFDNETEGWTDASSNWSTASGQASSSGNGSLTQAITTIVGETYTISIDAVTIVSPYVRVVVGGAVPVQLDVGYTGTKAGTFTATSTSTTIQINPYASGQTIDNISVRLAEEDRSVNDNGLQIFGEIDKTPVAPGADLVAYSGFSADDYLMQPYNSDLDFGTGDFSIMGWVKTNTSSNYQTILDFGLYDTDGSRRHFAVAANTGELYMGIQGSNTIGTHSVSVGNGSWHCCVATVVGNTINFYIDGKLAGSNNSLTLNSLDDSVGLRVGYGISDQYILEGRVSLIRISATVPTDAQIAKIYRDEKVLFQDGAQATLYGTSDAVTALAYDDKTELLHVGTSGGRSDFAGLRRINNTTIPVTTSISASNNLIAEQ